MTGYFQNLEHSPPTTRTYPLKLVPVILNVPSAAAWTAVEAAKAVAALTPAPHGFPLLGRDTSDRLGVPATPRAGATIACPWTETANARARKENFEEEIMAAEDDLWIEKDCDM
jgi:hypothetical protein